MNISFYSAVSGMLAQQESMNIVANNMANVQTLGYKPTRASFSDLIYTAETKKQADLQMGHGAKLSSTDMTFRQGTLEQTDRMLDFALIGDGFFAVQAPDGRTLYTRDGGFHMGGMDGEWTLLHSSGNPVLDYDGNPIKVPFIDDGQPDYGYLANVIGTFSFSNPYGLFYEAGNMFSATATSGEAQLDGVTKKLQGAVEGSAVDLAGEMAQIIKAQRAFQFSSKAIQTSDELEQIVNTLR